MASATVLARAKSVILLGWFCFLRRRQKRRTAALSGNPCLSVSSLGSCKALSSGRSGGDSGVEEDGEDPLPVSGDEEEDGGDSVPTSGDEEVDGGDPVPIPVLVGEEEEEEEGDWDPGGEEDGDAIILTLE